MNHEHQISDLLCRWEQLQQQGQSVTAADLCGDCPELLPELEDQIRAIRSMDAMLGTAETTDAAAGPATSDTLDESPGAGNAMSTRTNYRVIRSHAKGGLGEVLVAEDESLGREVALKVIRRPHDRDPQRRRRFVQEAEITSRLEHPGIVPVHGIGQDADGRLCYSMRLIRGESLQDAIRKFHEVAHHAPDDRASDLALRQLLGRFVTVCNTVAYAHSQGVIHRDLKPANIMLGGYGETLVVDWGLAKRPEVRGQKSEVREMDAAGSPIEIQTERTADHEQLTEHGSALGTPAFMSPEQSRGRLEELGAASDIYSLGATLYAMLTGRAPIEGGHIGEVAAKLARGDFPPPRRVKHDIPKPLEAICLKAMSLQPRDRYATALDLAGDVENWLADQPVSAWREPFGVRVRRWVQRHRMIVTGAAAALVVGIVSLGVVVAVVARSNRDLRLANERESAAKSEAEENARVAGEQSALALETLRTVVNDIQKKLKGVAAAHPVRRDLLKTALDGLQKVATNLETQSKVDRQTMLAHRELGEMFLQIGSGGELGETEAARRHFERSFDIAEKLAAAMPDDAEAQRDLATAFSTLGDLSRETGASDRAMQFYTESFRIRDKLKTSEPGDAEALRQLSLSFMRLGDLGRKSGNTEQALAYFLKALEIRERLAAPDPTNPKVLRDLQVVYNNLGQVHRQMGLSQQAQASYEKALAVGERRVAAEPGNTDAQQSLASTIVWLGDTSRQMGLFDQAKDHYEQAREVREKLLAADPDNVGHLGWLVIPLERLGGLSLRSGATDEAMQLFSRENELLRKLVEIDPASVWNRRSLAVSYDYVGDTYLKCEQAEPALERYRAAMKLREQLAGDAANAQAQGDLATSFSKIGDVLAKLDQPRAALDHHSKAVTIQEKLVAADPHDASKKSSLAALYQRMAEIHLESGSTEGARPYGGKMLDILTRLADADANDAQVKADLALCLQLLGTIEQREKHPAEAIAQFTRSLAILRTLEAERRLDASSTAHISELIAAIAECESAR